MVSGSRFIISIKANVRAIALLLTFFILLSEIPASPNEGSIDAQQFVHQWLDRTQKIIRQSYRNQDTTEVIRLMEQDTILLDAKYLSRLLGKHPIVNFEVKEAADSLREAHTFEMINRQNLNFQNYRTMKRDSRYYEIMRANFINLVEKLPDRQRWIQLNHPSGQSDVQFMRRYFVTLNSIDEYNQIKNKITANFKKITHFIEDESNADKNIAAINRSLAQAESLITEMQRLEVREKVIEQESAVELSYHLYHYYCEDFQKMTRLLQQDFRRLHRNGIWQFETNKIPCNVTVDICPQCRGLRWSDQKWMFRLVRFTANGKTTGWKIWSIDVKDIKEN